MQEHLVATPFVVQGPCAPPLAESLEAASLPTADHRRGQPLFSPDVEGSFNSRFDEEHRSYGQGDHEQRREQLTRDFLKELRARSFERVGEIVDGLLIAVGTRGANFVEFSEMFSRSGDADYRALVTSSDTPESRRTLHTILSSYVAIPKSWARSAWVRLLRGNGKQASDKFNYPGKGMFGTDYGWKESEIVNICDPIISGAHDYWSVRRNLLSAVMCSAADLEAEHAAKEAETGERDYDFDPRFAARIEKNKKLVGKMLQILEERGLGPIPDPIEKGPRQERKVKEFKVGDKINKGNLRDLPLPALVEVPVLKENYVDNPKHNPKDHSSVEPPRIPQHEPITVYWVVEKFNSGDGTFKCAMVPEYADGQNTDALVAYHAEPRSSHSWDNNRRKEFLNGAKFLGSFAGTVSKSKAFQYNFRLRLANGDSAY